MENGTNGSSDKPIWRFPKSWVYPKIIQFRPWLRIETYGDFYGIPNFKKPPLDENMTGISCLSGDMMVSSWDMISWDLSRGSWGAGMGRKLTDMLVSNGGYVDLTRIFDAWIGIHGDSKV